MDREMWKTVIDAMDAARVEIARMDDDQVWALACVYVGLARERAAEVDRPDLVKLFADFADGMRDYAGTRELLREN